MPRASLPAYASFGHCEYSSIPITTAQLSR